MKYAATDGSYLYSLSDHPQVERKETGLKISKGSLTFNQIFTMAQENEVEQLWALPGSVLYDKLKEKKRISTRSVWSIEPTGEMRNYLTGKLPGKRKIQLIAPGLTKGQWAIDDISDPVLLREVLGLFRRHIRIGASIPHRTMRLLAEQTINAESFWSPSDLQPFIDHTEKDFAFRRWPSKSEQRANWLHCYDKRSSYLNSSDIPLGVGETIEVRRKLTTEDLKKADPGLYYAEIYKGPELTCHWRVKDQTLGPAESLSPYHPLRWDLITGVEDYLAPAWYYGPTIRFFASRGYSVKVKKAYLYDRSHRVFWRWKNVLHSAIYDSIPNDSRYSDEARKIAIKCLKSGYTQFLGWLAKDPQGRTHKFFRPDWRYSIIADATARLAHNVCKARELVAYDTETMRTDRLTTVSLDHTPGLSVPIGVRLDSVLYLSEVADPQAALPPPFTGPGSSYRVKYSLPGKLAMPLLTDPNLRIGQLDDQLFELSKKWRKEIEKTNRKESN